MAYLSLYRKYRSQGFDEVMGQGHVTQTLRNAIRRGRIGHAYLFCGPRGTGKTSTARILAKALNCAQGPTPDPCNECEACQRVTLGHSLDVLEIDAASNRGIDEIRELREQVGRASAQERFKFYIIDEVHQLTGDAFNALLKTLEEPPPNVIFVLATTEYQKVPATIVSRCQRFDFKRGTAQELVDRLTFVARSEGVELDPEAAAMLASSATGSWRDALSLLEQVMAFSPERIGAAEVVEGLGLVGPRHLSDLAEAVADARPDRVFEAVESALSAGREPRQILTALCALFRDLLVLRSVGPAGASHLAPEQLEAYAPLALRFDLPVLVEALESLTQAEGNLRNAGNQRLALELPLVKLAARGALPAAGAMPARSQIPAPAPQAAQPVAAGQAPQDGSRRSDAKPSGPPPAEGPLVEGASRPSAPTPPVKEPVPDSSGTPAPRGGGSRKPAAPEPVEPVGTGASRPGGTSVSPGRDGEEAASGEGAGEAAPAETAQPTVTLDVIQGRWGDVLKHIARRNVQTLVEKAVPIRLDSKQLVLRPQYQGHMALLGKPEIRQAVEKAVEAAFGIKRRLKCELATQMALGDLEADPELKRICEIFEGELVKE